MKGVKGTLSAKSKVSHNFIFYLYETGLGKVLVLLSFFKGGSIEDASPLNTHCHQGALEN